MKPSPRIASEDMSLRILIDQCLFQGSPGAEAMEMAENMVEANNPESIRFRVQTERPPVAPGQQPCPELN